MIKPQQYIIIVLLSFLIGCGGGFMGDASSTHPSQGAPTSVPEFFISKNSENQLIISWDEEQSAQSYTVVLSSNENFDPASTTEINVTKPPFVVPTEKSGQLFYVKINADWDGKKIEGETKKSFIMPPLKPAIEEFGNGEVITDTEIRLKWQGDAQKYNLYFSDNPEVSISNYTNKITDVEGQFFDTDLSKYNAGDIVYVFITAVSANEESAISDVIKLEIGEFKYRVMITSTENLVGSGLSLVNKNNEKIEIKTSSTEHKFNHQYSSLDPYEISIDTQPNNPPQFCTIDSPSGEFGTSNVSLTIQCISRPNLPSTFRAIPDTQQIRLAWLAGDTTDSLRIFRDTSETVNTSNTPLVESVTGNEYVDRDVISGTKYYYKIVAINKAGQSDVSESVNAIPISPKYKISVSSVQGLVGEGLVLSLDNQQDLDITSQDSIKDFSGSYSKGASYSVVIKSHPVNPVQFCKLTNNAGTIDRNVNISVECFSDINAPNNLSVISRDNIAYLNWDAVANVDGYSIFMSTQADFLVSDAQKTFESTATNFLAGPLNSNLKYYFKVASKIGTANSPPSDEVSTALNPSHQIFSSGDEHQCEIHQNGTLWCWGDNFGGQIGDGTLVDKMQPVQIGSDIDWVQIGLGSSHSCAIKQNGSLWCWGYNNHGQLGDDSFVRKSVPTQIGQDFDWKFVDGGWRHTCAVKQNGNLYCWGDNREGQVGLGDNNIVDISTPQLISSDGLWQKISMGDEFSCGLKTGGNTFCWGENDVGQIANGDFINQFSIVQISGVAFDEIKAGQDHVCALKADKTLWCWGGNYDGQLGIGNSSNINIVQQVGLESNWEFLSVGGASSCAINTNSDLYCWGYNEYGQLGNGSMVDVNTPLLIQANSDWVYVTRAWRSVCGLKQDNSVLCWGGNDHGQLGLGNRGGTLVPQLISEGKLWNQITTEENFSCALDNINQIWCWGRNLDSQFGNNSVLSSKIPLLVNQDTDWVLLASGDYHACGIKSGGSLWCWGDNGSGQLGDGTYTDKSSAVQVGVDTDWLSVNAGTEHTCAQKTNKSLYCWGWNEYGQIGNGDNDFHNTPQLIDPGALTWLSFDATHDNGCAIKSDNTLWCWGRNDDGQLGVGTIHESNTDTNVPVQETTLSANWLKVGVGEHYACGIQAADVNALVGSLWCWGRNGDYQLGNGDATQVSITEPQQIGSDVDWKSVALGGYHSCAIKSSNDLYCWGENFQGQVGVGSRVDQDVPTLIQNGANWLSVDAGRDHSCGLKTDNTLWCWGENNFGQVGNDNSWKLNPTPVVGRSVAP